jgi:hypothetical protein
MTRAALLASATVTIRVGRRANSCLAQMDPPTAPSTCLVGVTGGRRLASSIGNSLATRAADLGPDLKCLGSGSSVLGSSDVIAAEME